MAEDANTEEDGNSGHNAPNGERVLGFLQRIERLEEEKAAIAADIKEVKLEASKEGIETKVINELLRQRKLQEKMGRQAYTDFQDSINICTDAMGQSYWAFEQMDLEDTEGVTQH